MDAAHHMQDHCAVFHAFFTGINTYIMRFWLYTQNFLENVLCPVSERQNVVKIDAKVTCGVPRNFFRGGGDQIQLRTERMEIWGQ
jgi:hypothetical protein